MKMFISAFVVSVYVLTIARADFCPETEIRSFCKNPCEPTCHEPHKTPCPTFTCQSGCSCRDGTVRDEITGQCVALQHCPIICPANEVPNDFRACEPTCQNQNQLQCIFQHKKCICKPGFLRDLTSGKCVAPDCCPAECGIDQVWNSCDNPGCKKTCRTITEHVHCSEKCTPGCDCREGLVWDENCNKCVPETQCPKACGINEEWRNCSGLHCRKTCQNPEPGNCPQICTPGCACKEGYLWDEEKKQCVLKEECPKYCEKYQEWKECSDINCQETCQKAYPMLCTMECIPGCSCIDGYIWDEHYRKCVPRGECSKVCNRHAKWYENIPRNPPTCRSIAEGRPNRDLKFPRSGCICKRGYVWDEFSQKCVQPRDCPQPIRT